jgi:KaiC/GvpD/RAD55 family RecA-like ATPase
MKKGAKKGNKKSSSAKKTKKKAHKPAKTHTKAKKRAHATHKKHSKAKKKTHAAHKKHSGAKKKKSHARASRPAARSHRGLIRQVHRIVAKGRESTSIPGFDQLIEGGFEKNSTNLIVGGSGSGKSIFCMQFLMSGMRKGEKCMYVTFEEKKDQFFANMKEFGWDLAAYEKKGLFIFLEYTPIRVKTMLEEGGGAIENIILKKKISRMVIDSVTSFALLFDKELEKREAALSLFNMIRKWNCTSMLTIESDPTKDNSMESRAIEFESDSIVVLYYVRDKGERGRFIEVLKMRGTKHSQKMYSFDIGTKGISVSTKSVSRLPIDLC